jgi:hypothetical protein
MLRLARLLRALSALASVRIADDGLHANGMTVEAVVVVRGF